MTRAPRQDLSVLDQRGVGRPASRRRPLRQPVPRTWFLQTPEFRLYALREASSLVVGLSVIHLVGAIVAINRGVEAWARWLAFQRQPAVVVATLFVLGMAILHAVTWFHVTPAIVRVRVGTWRLPGWCVITAQYVVAIAILVVFVWWIAVSTS